MRLTLGFALLAIPFSLTGAPVVRFEPTQVVASGITPHGRAVFFGVAREPQQLWISLVPRRAVVTDSVGDGVARLEIADGVPRFSAWGVVDLGSGQFRLAAPPDSPFEQVAFPFNGIRRNAGNEMERLVSGRSHLHLLWVRPGTGAWVFAGGDGGSSDEDRSSNGRVSIRAEDMRPLGESGTAPKHFRPGDVLVGIDPVRRVYFASEVTQ